MAGHVLRGLQLAHGFGHVTRNRVVVHFHGLDHAIGVDHEGATQGQAFFRDMHAKGVGELMGGVADQRELRLAHRRAGFVPHLVAEVGVGGDDIDLGTGFLELGVMLGGVFDLGRAIEGKCGRHEDQYRPMAFQAGFGHFDELAIMEGVGLERLHLRVDQGHENAPVWCGWVGSEVEPA